MPWVFTLQIYQSNMLKFFYSRINSFKFAFNGLFFLVKNEKNAWIHLAATLFVTALGILIKLNPAEWLFILLAIFLVWITELLNTAIEELVNLVEPNTHPKAKIIKDLAAGAVLSSAIFAVIVGLIVILPKIYSSLWS